MNIIMRWSNVHKRVFSYGKCSKIINILFVINISNVKIASKLKPDCLPMHDVDKKYSKTRSCVGKT